MKKSNRKVKIRRETLCPIDSVETSLIRGGEWPYQAPRTQLNCGLTATCL